eukprot:102291_1
MSSSDDFDDLWFTSKNSTTSFVPSGFTPEANRCPPPLSMLPTPVNLSEVMNTEATSSISFPLSNENWPGNGNGVYGEPKVEIDTTFNKLPRKPKREVKPESNDGSISTGTDSSSDDDILGTQDFSKEQKELMRKNHKLIQEKFKAAMARQRQQKISDVKAACHTNRGEAVTDEEVLFMLKLCKDDEIEVVEKVCEEPNFIQSVREMMQQAKDNPQLVAMKSESSSTADDRRGDSDSDSGLAGTGSHRGRASSRKRRRKMKQDGVERQDMVDENFMPSGDDSSDHELSDGDDAFDPVEAAAEQADLAGSETESDWGPASPAKRPKKRRKKAAKTAETTESTSNPPPPPTLETYSFVPGFRKDGKKRAGRLLLEDALKNAVNMDGWSDARIKAYRSIDTNPNSYYYRFNAPGEKQQKSKFREEEGEFFMKRLEEVGPDCGWGIFAMGIPGRVGYQCSNYYRQSIQEGKIHDDRYWQDSNGKLRFNRYGRAGELTNSKGGKNTRAPAEVVKQVRMKRMENKARIDKHVKKSIKQAKTTNPNQPRVLPSASLPGKPSVNTEKPPKIKQKRKPRTAKPKAVPRNRAVSNGVKMLPVQSRSVVTPAMYGTHVGVPPPPPSSVGSKGNNCVSVRNQHVSIKKTHAPNGSIAVVHKNRPGSNRIHNVPIPNNRAPTRNLSDSNGNHSNGNFSGMNGNLPGLARNFSAPNINHAQANRNLAHSNLIRKAQNMLAVSQAKTDVARMRSSAPINSGIPAHAFVARTPCVSPNVSPNSSPGTAHRPNVFQQNIQRFTASHPSMTQANIPQPPVSNSRSQPSQASFRQPTNMNSSMLGQAGIPQPPVAHQASVPHTTSSMNPGFQMSVSQPTSVTVNSNSGRTSISQQLVTTPQTQVVQADPTVVNLGEIQAGKTDTNLPTAKPGAQRQAGISQPQSVQPSISQPSTENSGSNHAVANSGLVKPKLPLPSVTESMPPSHIQKKQPSLAQTKPLFTFCVTNPTRHIGPVIPPGRPVAKSAVTKSKVTPAVSVSVPKAKKRTRQPKSTKTSDETFRCSYKPEVPKRCPLPQFMDPITHEKVINPAISPYGHVMGYETWTRILRQEPKNICPLTKLPLTR